MYMCVCFMCVCMCVYNFACVYEYYICGFMPNGGVLEIYSASAGRNSDDLVQPFLFCCFFLHNNNLFTILTTPTGHT